MKLVYVCKNSWWDKRKARKALLPYALSELENTNVMLVNAAIPFYKCKSHPRLWVHPATKMKVFTPRRLLPLQRFSLVRKVNQLFRWKSILKQIERCSFEEVGAPTVFILSDPEDIYLAQYVRGEGYLCYFDWTEDWGLYKQLVGEFSQTKVDVNHIFLYVDGTVVVSEKLKEKAQDLGLDYLHLQNAVSDQFVQQLERCEEKEDPMEGIPKPRAIHVGSYNPAWIHWDWLIHAANQNPAISFCMIGGGGEDDMPAELPNNIYLLGRIQYEDIPAYLRHSQACMLLYKEKATAAGDPTKLYEYLATGLPIIASPHPRCLDFQAYIYVARDAEAFNNQLHLALEEHGDEREKRVLESKKHTWSIRAKQLLAWLKG